MSDYLCLRFRDSSIEPHSVVSWSLLATDAKVISSGHVLLSQLQSVLPTLDSHTRCVVIIPGSAVLLTSIELPAKQLRHVKQVLPFVVEDQIIDPVESMHLTTPVLYKGNKIPVAAVKRNVIAGWLDQLSEVDIKPDYMFVDSYCLPSQQGQWQLMVDHETALFRDDECSGMTIDYSMAKSVLNMAILNQQGLTTEYNEEQNISNEAKGDNALNKENNNDDGNVANSEYDVVLLSVNCKDRGIIQQLYKAEIPDNDGLAEITSASQDSDDSGVNSNAPIVPIIEMPGQEVLDKISAESDVIQRKYLDELDSFIRSENMSTNRIHYSETSTELLAVSAVKSLDKNLNLLQGDFRPANANAENRRFMRRIAFGVAACLGLFLIVTLGGGAYLNYRSDSYFDRSVTIYRELFPKQRKVIDPVRQMKRQLSGQAIGTTTSEFLPLLDAASRSLAALSEQSAVEASIKQLRYDIQRGNISIDIHASNIDDLEAYRDLLAGEGLNVDILSANQDGDTIKGRIQIGRS